MKTLANPNVTLSADGKSVTITADIADVPFNGWLTSRVSHSYVNQNNMKHVRHVQSSNQAVFVKSRHGGAAMSNEVIAKIAAAIEPGTTFPPVFKKSSTPGSVQVFSEIPCTFQWQVSDNAFPPPAVYPAVTAAVWTDIAGATGAVLDESTVKDGQWIRCVATNAAGSTISQPAQKKAATPTK